MGIKKKSERIGRGRRKRMEVREGIHSWASVGRVGMERRKNARKRNKRGTRALHSALELAVSKTQQKYRENYRFWDHFGK